MSITLFLADDRAEVRDRVNFLLETQPALRVVDEAADGWERRTFPTERGTVST